MIPTKADHCFNPILQGGKADWWYDDYIPQDVSWELNVPVTNVPMVNEGGSIEVDGRGTLMAKRSSIINRNRNPTATQANVEAYFRRYLGVSNFIWLDGTPGLEITDDHIGTYHHYIKLIPIFACLFVAKYCPCSILILALFPINIRRAIQMDRLASPMGIPL